jgi:hypothetical protein
VNVNVAGRLIRAVAVAANLLTAIYWCVGLLHLMEESVVSSSGARLLPLALTAASLFNLATLAIDRPLSNIIALILNGAAALGFVIMLPGQFNQANVFFWALFALPAIATTAALLVRPT